MHASGVTPLERRQSVIRITGIAFGGIGATTAFASVVRKP